MYTISQAGDKLHSFWDQQQVIPKRVELVSCLGDSVLRLIVDRVLNLAFVIVVVAESVIDLRERETMNAGDLFGISARLKLQNHMSYAGVSTLNDRFTVVDRGIPHNIGVRGAFKRHNWPPFPKK